MNRRLTLKEILEYLDGDSITINHEIMLENGLYDLGIDLESRVDYADWDEKHIISTFDQFMEEFFSDNIEKNISEKPAEIISWWAKKWSGVDTLLNIKE